MNVNLSIAHEIIRMALRSGAIEIAPNYAQLLSCKKGKKLLLNNKSKHLAKLKEWKMLIPAFVKLINSQGIKYDYIVGTATAGIPWASLLAQELNMPLCVLNDEKLIQIDTFTKIDIAKASTCDVIACNAPMGIPIGMHIAKQSNKPLVYIREFEHPFGKMVEGEYFDGQTAYLIEDSLNGEMNTLRNEKLLHDADLNLLLGFGRSKKTVINPKKKKFLLIDDLLTNGGSFNEAIAIRNMEGTVEHLLTLFDQSTNIALAKKKELGLHVHAIVTMEDILDIATKEGYLEPGLAERYAKDILNGKITTNETVETPEEELVS